MRRLALIVEGQGDESAIPALISRLGKLFGTQVYAPHPIRAGGLCRLSRAGELERFAIMAASRDEADAVLIVLDIDDGCPVSLYNQFKERVRPIEERFGKNIDICLAVREYECWLLCDIENLMSSTTEYDWQSNVKCENPESIRGAKEFLAKIMGRRYRETVDQLVLTRNLDISSTYHKSRSFKKFTRAVLQIDYTELDELLKIAA